MKLIEHNFNPTSISPSTLSNHNRNHLRQLRSENVRPHVPLAMRRVPARIIPNFQSSSVYPKSIMASEGTKEILSDELQKKGVEEEKEEKEKEKEKKKSVKLPPPPEKPLPGDCCGSGCVRCVWDVYYEELEAYNRLCEKASAPNS